MATRARNQNPTKARLVELKNLAEQLKSRLIDERDAWFNQHSIGMTDQEKLRFAGIISNEIYDFSAESEPWANSINACLHELSKPELTTLGSNQYHTRCLKCDAYTYFHVD